MHRFNIGHNYLVGEVDLIKVTDDLLGDLLRDVIINRRVCLDGAILVVADLVKRGNVHTGNGLGGFVQKRLTGIATFVLHFYVKAHDRGEHILTLTNVKQVKKVGNRLGVIGAGTATNNQGILLAAILGAQRQLRKGKHIEHVCVTHFVLQGKADKIECREGIAALQSGQRQVMLAHFLLHIRPRGKNALAPNIGVLIEGTVKQTHTQIGHTDLVRIGKAEGKACLDLFFVFYDLTVLATRVSAGLGDRFEDGTVEFCRVVHSVPFLCGFYFSRLKCSVWRLTSTKERINDASVQPR